MNQIDRAPQGRSFKTLFPRGFLRHYSRGTMRYRYRDRSCLKSPIDIAIYLRLLWDKKPATVIEIGSKDGGSALFFRDMAQLFRADAKVVTIDLHLPHAFKERDITALVGDVRNLDETFTRHGLYDCPRPWLVIEDSAHHCDTTLAALKFFAHHLRPGEYLVIEDGSLSDMGRSAEYGGGPNAAIETFLREQPDVFEIDPAYCDMFGPNATYNPNGYLKKL